MDKLAGRNPWWMTAGAAAVGVVVLLPLAYLVIRAFQSGAGPVLETLANRRTGDLMIRTLLLTLAVTAAAVFVGVTLALTITRTDLPARKLWTMLAALPLVIPSYLMAYTFVAFFGPRGLLQQALSDVGVGRLPSMFGFPGAFVALTLVTYPYVFLAVRGALLGISGAQEEAGRTLAGSRWEVLRRVTLPQLVPAITAGGLLSALYTIHDFGAVSLMRYDTYTLAIYLNYSASFDRTQGAVLSLVLVVLSLVVVAVLREGRQISYQAIRDSGRRAAGYRLGRWAPAAVGLHGLVALLALGIPLGVTLAWLFRGLASQEPMRLAIQAGLNSLTVSGAAAVMTVAAAIPVAMLSARRAGIVSRVAEKAAYAGYALPGIVVALALVFFGIRVATPFYQTRALLLFAYLVLFLPQALGPLRASALQLQPELEQAARTLGRSRLAALTSVVLPQMRGGLAAGAVLVFLTTMKELPATLLLAPAGFSTLATDLWGATSDAFFGRAAPAALGLVLLASIPLALVLLAPHPRPRPGRRNPPTPGSM